MHESGHNVKLALKMASEAERKFSRKAKLSIISFTNEERNAVKGALNAQKKARTFLIEMMRNADMIISEASDMYGSDFGALKGKIGSVIEVKRRIARSLDKINASIETNRTTLEIAEAKTVREAMAFSALRKVLARHRNITRGFDKGMETVQKLRVKLQRREGITTPEKIRAVGELINTYETMGDEHHRFYLSLDRYPHELMEGKKTAKRIAELKAGYERKAGLFKREIKRHMVILSALEQKQEKIARRN